MSKVYIPTDYLNNCNVIYPTFIRSFTNDSKTEWVDIYPKMNYSIQKGSGTSSIVECNTINDFTDDYFYRIDFDSILVIFFIISILCFYFPYHIFSRAFGRFLSC